VEVVAGRVDTQAYRALMASQCARARSYFIAANPLPPCVEADSRTTVRVMGGVYRRVLDRVAADPVRAYAIRADLPRWQRLWAVLAGHLGLPFA
jgi:phytoene synthase